MEFFIIKNEEGVEVEIPIKYKIEVMDMIKSKCYGCLEKFLDSINKKYN